MINIRDIFKLYSKNEVLNYKKIDSSKNDCDKRFTYLVRYENGLEIAVKVTRNSFTSPYRVEQWQKLCRFYLKAGIYCPQIIKNAENNYSKEFFEGNNKYVVYAEEMKKYKCVNEFDIEPEYKKYREKSIETIGIIASKNIKLVPWNTAYCLYDKFTVTDDSDENYECAKNFCLLFKNTEYEDYVNIIWKIYINKKRKFEADYRKLPKAVFQGDLNSTNIMLDENMNFKGLIDFNLSGTDTILNYAFCESFCYLDNEDLDNLMDCRSLKEIDNYTKHNLDIIKRHYKFTLEEKQAYNRYYNIVAPFRWPNYCMFCNVIKSKNTKYINQILDWVYYQLTRNDIEL